MSSKIKVDTIENVAGSGNVSLGSGHNLVVPGNITGSGTATITGDLTVDTSTLKVDSSNNRTIMGYTSGRVPTSVIVPHVNSSIAPAMRITTHGNAGYSSSNSQGAGARLEFGQYDDGYDWITGSIASTRTCSNWGGDLIFSTNNNSASNNQTEVMRINRDGHITTPNRPAFLATGSNNNYINTSPVPFPTVVYNVGSHYNNSNYTFTAPIAGKYWFHAHFGLANGSSTQNIYPWFHVNGSNQQYSYVNFSTTWYATAHLTCVFNLSANDTVKVTVSAGGGGTYYNGANETRFMGYLLG